MEYYKSNKKCSSANNLCYRLFRNYKLFQKRDFLQAKKQKYLKLYLKLYSTFIVKEF